MTAWCQFGAKSEGQGFIVKSWAFVLLSKVEPAVGLEPTTCGLRNRCSATELRWHPHLIRRPLYLSLTPASSQAHQHKLVPKIQPPYLTPFDTVAMMPAHCRKGGFTQGR